MCACPCVHACLHTCTAGTISLFVCMCVCVCDSYHLCLSLSLLCHFCVAIKFITFFAGYICIQFVFEVVLFCFTKLSEYVEDYDHSHILVYFIAGSVCVCVCVCVCVHVARVPMHISRQ